MLVDDQKTIRRKLKKSWEQKQILFSLEGGITTHHSAVLLLKTPKGLKRARTSMPISRIALWQILIPTASTVGERCGAKDFCYGAGSYAWGGVRGIGYGMGKMGEWMHADFQYEHFNDRSFFQDKSYKATEGWKFLGKAAGMIR
jgi:hypothetical protein